jgi:hypothetical protein
MKATIRLFTKIEVLYVQNVSCLFNKANQQWRHTDRAFSFIFHYTTYQPLLSVHHGLCVIQMH